MTKMTRNIFKFQPQVASAKFNKCPAVLLIYTNNIFGPKAISCRKHAEKCRNTPHTFFTSNFCKSGFINQGYIPKIRTYEI